MSNVLKGLKPGGVFKFFEDICAIPHGSGNVKGLSDYCVAFAKERGLEVFHLRFSNALFKKRFVTAGLQGRELVQVAYDPDCMDCVWLYENGTYTAFDLVHKSYRGKSLAEVIDAQRMEKASRQDWTAQELQAQLDLMADISSIASCSEPLHIEKGQIGEQIQQNRMAAREQEHLSMFDLLGAQQEVDFHDC